MTVDELRRVRRLVEIATVQNRFTLGEQGADDVLKERGRRERIPAGNA